MRKLMAALGLMAALVFMPSIVKASGGLTTWEVGQGSATAVMQVVSGAGTLYDIEIDSAATAGDWIVCYDTAGVAGITGGGAGGGDCIGSASNCKKIGNTTAVTTTTGYSMPSKQPRVFSNGLVCTRKVASTIGRILYQSP